MRKSTVIILSFFFFAAVNAVTGYYIYLHQELLKQFDPNDYNTWIGWALAAGPMACWLLFALITAMIPGQEVKADQIQEVTPSEEDDHKEQQEDLEDKGDIQTKAMQEEPQPKSDIETLYPKEVAIVQLLGLLQREGRLIDFLQEDIEPYDDAQIGAAVRQVHRGCRKALQDALGLEPVLDLKEGSELEIDEDFDSTKIRLIGNVHGDPPYKGILRHCGWRFTRIDLPEWTGKEKTDVLAPAEVEIQ